MNFFSIFDPSTSMSYSLNWFSTFLILTIFPYQFWFIPSRFTMFWNLFYSLLLKEFKLLILYSFSNLLMFLSLFFMIFWINFFSLFPYIFASSSHLSFSMSLALMMWLMIMIYFIITNSYNFFIHITPPYTPTLLIPMMNLIELISLLIRPITLSIRLSANMIAGHLLLSLLGSFCLKINNNLILIMILMMIMLYTLEIFVSFIQSYVFSILTLLYSKEI